MSLVFFFEMWPVTCYSKDSTILALKREAKIYIYLWVAKLFQGVGQ